MSTLSENQKRIIELFRKNGGKLKLIRRQHLYSDRFDSSTMIDIITVIDEPVTFDFTFLSESKNFLPKIFGPKTIRLVRNNILEQAQEDRNIVLFREGRDFGRNPGEVVILFHNDSVVEHGFAKGTKIVATVHFQFWNNGVGKDVRVFDVLEDYSHLFTAAP